MRTLLFFIESPCEELTSVDIRAKFGVKVTSMGLVLQPLVDRGMLSVVRSGGNVPDLWAAGPKLQALQWTEDAACKPQAR